MNESGGRVVDAGSPDVHSVVVHEPVGVCALITPWNYPLLQASWKIAPALAAGNTFVIKPSEVTPLSTVAPGQAAGRGRTAGRGRQHRHRRGPARRASGSPSTRTSTCSPSPADWSAARRSARPRSSGVKKVALELGGKNPNVVFADACATDEGFDTAVDQALNAAFIHSGQVCSAGARLIIEESVRDRFVAELARRAEKIKLGRGTEDGVECGPLVSQQQLDKVEAYVASALAEGAAAALRRHPAQAVRRPPGHRLLLRADRARRLPPRDEGGPRGDLRADPDGRDLPHRGRGRRARQRHRVRPGRRRLVRRHRARPPGRRPAAARHGLDQRLPPLPPAGGVGRLRQVRHRHGNWAPRGWTSTARASTSTRTSRRSRCAGSRADTPPRHLAPPAPRTLQEGAPPMPVYDYVVVGGGTAGSVIASRLTEDPDVTRRRHRGRPVRHRPRRRPDAAQAGSACSAATWTTSTPTTEQPRGNSHILHSRAKVLGGCSSHNTLISFKPLPSDWDEWEAAGAEPAGTPRPMDPYFGKLRNNIVRGRREGPERRSPATSSRPRKTAARRARASRASTSSPSTRASASSTSPTTRRTTSAPPPRSPTSTRT